MTGNTGLLTSRCDPYGAESRIKLLGGLYPESYRGRIMWHCENRASARYRMVCTGGEYGRRVSPDGGLVPSFICDGGHQGQVMELCTDHRREIAKRQSDLCPACAYPPRARDVTERIEYLSFRLREAALNLPLYAKMTAQMQQLSDEMTELRDQGIIHKCPLRLVEVS